jgi:predicted membrane metal-binding protein
VFAVSGLHIGFIVALLNFVFRKLRVKRVIKAIVITLALLFYSGV